ncbi:uncharacterized protein EHS24_000609 [Apiotrichum porosum]|uniref:Phospholipid/glycerol acyltransferase domain-containing protein n=1 Tax=Apiotrichum porosum TaxID=105984 RepID=A0A427YAE9_9TREE|nr:uncharacterized protein EHS24_000609 [Apiotrichum porosum]RSH88082.1 hypothetical protein EHS24_000609 [Apiotrichum porosum]
MSSTPPPLYTLPIDKRPPGYGPWFSKIVFPIVFNLGILGISSAQFLFLPLLLIPILGRPLFRRAIAWTKDGFGRLLLCAPTSLVITTDEQPELATIVERDSNGDVVKINLPDRMVVIANHQAYTDWMYLWILACYSGYGDGITILLKASLKHLPIVGWGMQFFRFIFLKRSWAADKDNLTQSLNRLARLAKEGQMRSPLWLLIFPEGTITSDNERAKSKRYADRERVDDFVGVLHPRSTGLLFCLRTLLPSIPDLKLLDVTISYPGVPFGKYPQEWYSLGSVFLRSVPPPVVHVHLRLYSDLGSASCEVPSLDLSTPGGSDPAEAKEFEIWLRSVWAVKEQWLKRLAVQGATVEEGAEVVPIKQLRWSDWVAAFGGGGVATLYAVARLL